MYSYEYIIRVGDKQEGGLLFGSAGSGTHRWEGEGGGGSAVCVSWFRDTQMGGGRGGGLLFASAGSGTHRWEGEGGGGLLFASAGSGTHRWEGEGGGGVCCLRQLVQGHTDGRGKGGGRSAVCVSWFRDTQMGGRGGLLFASAGSGTHRWEGGGGLLFASAGSGTHRWEGEGGGWGSK